MSCEYFTIGDLDPAIPPTQNVALTLHSLVLVCCLAFSHANSPDSLHLPGRVYIRQQPAVSRGIERREAASTDHGNPKHDYVAHQPGELVCRPFGECEPCPADEVSPFVSAGRFTPVHAWRRTSSVLNGSLTHSAQSAVLPTVRKPPTTALPKAIGARPGRGACLGGMRESHPQRTARLLRICRESVFT